ncbi:ATP-binding protein [Pseudolysobacter antarcticus]|uniref:ATP-binding protein n=1 Tax=Pseudolysobacter antarcticus TaxID=2511995 RepID=A0A411HLY7_9GAMM|nr:ATP-binding protein [Pseudolysobacter antarcticus]QBB71536.1 ATP-binding protein [Pseudolysobacter antarcticus]
MKKPILVAWSGGKDCLMALDRLLNDPQWRVVGLLTTITTQFDRVAMHGIRRDVLRAQAAALGLPLIESELEYPASNAAYETAFAASLDTARAITPDLNHIAFGDLFLTDVRSWRETLLQRLDWHAVLPLWHEPTDILARRFHAAGHRAVLTCVDTTQLAADFSGRDFDPALLAEFPAGVDPCGENGEFHTLSYAGPCFRQRLHLQRGENVLRDGRFQYTDFLLGPVSS